jgi:Exostosin family
MKLKIYSDKQYLPEGIAPDPILYPFWKEFIPNQSYSWFKACDKYIETSSSIFEMTSLEEADFAVMPANWRNVRGDSWRHKVNKQARDLSFEFAKKIEESGKPLVVFFSGDCCDEDIAIRNAITIRQGLYASRRSQNDFIMPAFVEDLIHYYLQGKISIRQKADKPVIGFCGLAKKDSLGRKLKAFLYHGLIFSQSKRLRASPYKGEILRTKILKHFTESPLVNTNFIVRDNSIFLTGDNEIKKHNSRYEFVKNMQESDYIINCRGSGNYSHRLIETFCCGRIPIFINTDCMLPYDSTINWKDYCIWVEERELPFLDEKVLDFHSQLSKQDFVDLQYECRKLWEQWLSAEGFYTNFYKYIEEVKINKNNLTALPFF